jgi:hypothetical protein
VALLTALVDRLQLQKALADVAFEQRDRLLTQLRLQI